MTDQWDEAARKFPDWNLHGAEITANIANALRSAFKAGQGDKIAEGNRRYMEGMTAAAVMLKVNDPNSPARESIEAAVQSLRDYNERNLPIKE